jgi:hypothetical protein
MMKTKFEPVFTPVHGATGACPACGLSARFSRFEVARQQDQKIVDILICSSCSVLINGGAYAAFEAQPDSREIQRTDYYTIGAPALAEEMEQVAKAQSMIKYLTERVDRNWAALTFCDLGAGRGYTAIAASESFSHSIACEFDLRNIREVCSVVGQPNNLELSDDIFKTRQNIDVLFAWHVLEHIPHLHNFIADLQETLNDDCTIFLQCPCYRPDYIVECHYLFFNEVSLRETMRQSGFREIEIGFDADNGFISYLGTLSA